MGGVTQQTAVAGGQGAKNDLPSVRAVRDDEATSIGASAAVKREGTPWCLTLFLSAWR